ncbi:MAG: hypothetical protein F6K48_07395 [Okeania sp. SIO3H1]|nr:hypothetical protein [Okeania sp. SIO3H1]
MNDVAVAQAVDKSIKNPNNPEVYYMSERDIRSAENSLDRNNCALFRYRKVRRRKKYGIRYGIRCAYGDAGTRNDILNAVQQGRAWAFSGNGDALRFYIDRVGINRAVVKLQRLGINY